MGAMPPESTAPPYMQRPTYAYFDDLCSGGGGGGGGFFFFFFFFYGIPRLKRCISWQASQDSHGLKEREQVRKLRVTYICITYLICVLLTNFYKPIVNLS